VSVNQKNSALSLIESGKAAERPWIMVAVAVVMKNPWEGQGFVEDLLAPVQEELAILVHTISHRVARFLERQGILERDEENSYLQLDGIDDDPMQQLIGCSISYRIAVGPLHITLSCIRKAFITDIGW
jgi:hypothetical protein